MRDRKTVVPNCSAFGIYWKSLSDSSSSQESLQCSAQPKKWQGQRSHTAHTTRPQTRQAPTKQSAMGICKIPMNPIEAWSQISTLSWLIERSTFLELWLFHGITSNQHFKLSEGLTFLCYFIEVATGYCWSIVPYSVLFGTTLHSHLTKGFLCWPAGGRAPVRRSTTSAGYCIGVVAETIFNAEKSVGGHVKKSITLSFFNRISRYLVLKWRRF